MKLLDPIARGDESRADSHSPLDGMPGGTARCSDRLRHAFLQAAIPMALTDLDGKFLDVNPALCQMLGYSESELQQATWPAIVHPQDRDPVLEMMRLYRDGHVPAASIARRYIHHIGREIWAEANVSLARDPAGEPLYFVVQILDVTSRRMAEWLAVDWRQVLEMVAQDQPLPSVLHQLVRLIERQTPGAWACVMLLQDGTIRPFAPSLPRAFADALSGKPVSFAARLAAGGAESGAAPRVADVETDAAWDGLRAEAAAAGLQTCWSMTIGGSDAIPLGVLVICSTQRRPPLPAECAVLQTAARLAAIGVEHHQTTRQLAHLVRHDPLTGLPNRLLFEDRLHQALSAARRSGTNLALLALDLNRFKHINDTLGHQAGDSLLQQFAQRLRGQLRESDTLARVGGDEFMLILPEIQSRPDAEVVVSRMGESLSATPFELAGRPVHASSSIGIALYPADGEDAAQLQRAADAAMYRVKQRRRPPESP